MKKYCYLISYHHKYTLGLGLGTSCITLNKKIKTYDDITDIAKRIEYENKVENVGIISFQRLKKT